MSATSRREHEFTAEELVALAQENHMWINAIAMINPTEEMLANIGRWVVKQVRQSPIRSDVTGLSPIAYLRVNAS